MSEGRLCPACSRDIGYWPIMKMPWPNVGLSCPHCRAKLSYEPAGFWAFALLIPYVPLLLALAWPVYERVRSFWGAAAIILAAALLLWLPFEWFIAQRFRARSRLVLKAPGDAS